MQYFGFDRPSFGIKTFGFGESGPKLQADFTTGTYKADGAAKTFADLFTFNRAGKAWLVKDTGLQEYASDVPRFDDGLLIEQSATNLTAFSTANHLAPEASGTYAAGSSSTVTFGAFEMVGVADGGYYYKNRSVVFSEPSMVSFYMPTDSGEHSVDFRSVNGDVVFDEPRYGLKRGSYIIASASSGNNRYGMYRIGTTTTGDNKLVGLFQEELGRVTSLIKTEEIPVTRPADYLLNKITGTTVTGDWDSTLTLSIVDGQLVHSGYGRIRSLEIN